VLDGQHPLVEVAKNVCVSDETYYAAHEIAFESPIIAFFPPEGHIAGLPGSEDRLFELP
jgi:hypothetical protein